MRNKKEKVICIICGTTTAINQYRIKKNKKYFCSDKCRRSYNERVKIKCVFCGKKFNVVTSRASVAKYCSNRCKWKQMGKNYRKYIGRNSGFIALDRKRALEKYGKKCEMCAWDRLVEIHHLDGNRNNHDIKNLCVLCPNHHTLSEKKYKKNKHHIIEINLRKKLNRWLE